jgi:pantoate--beta-alanine ligase
MKIVTSRSALRQLSQEWRANGQRVALVPTMGCLHQGHLMLMRMAKNLAHRVVASIFVNPMQFGPGEDFSVYPRQFAEDCRLLDKEGVSAVFHPSVDEMYGPSFQTTVRVTQLAEGLCGADRPGHFDGVATVVCKLFQLASPHLAIFGEKDLQQLAIVKQLVKDLNFPLEVIGHPIVREDDGLAMSSRNRYLSASERQKALCLFRAISEARSLVAGESSTLTADAILEQARSSIAAAGVALEYAAVVDETTLRHDQLIGPGSVLALAAKITERVRLIDNGRLIL